jgi:CSLREA domain-containing protein
VPRICLLAVLLASALLLSARPQQHAIAGFAVVTVDTTADDNGTCDDGNCSLREALMIANTTPTEVRFNIAGAGPHAIAVTTPLPTITQPVIIDGTTEPDYAGSPIVVLDGALLDAGNGLVLQGGGSSVRGVVVCNFAGAGILIDGPGGNHIESNYIGVDPSGAVAQPNTTGISVSSTDNVIGGSAGVRNVISGNATAVELLPGATGNDVDHNYIGTRADGVGALPNVHGIALDRADGNAVTANVISGNIAAGVTLASATTGCRATGSAST